MPWIDWTFALSLSVGIAGAVVGLWVLLMIIGIIAKICEALLDW